MGVTEGQIGILVSAAAILAVAAALWRQQVLGTVPLAVAVACVLGVSGFLVLSF
jgi:predicted exporter